MATKGAPEATFPAAAPCTSYWQQTPDEIADLRSTADLPDNADVVIIGSGVSGSSIAYNLLTAKPELKIVMLEARQAASGASGRNGGHTKTATYRSFVENVAAVGEDEAVKISKLEYNCMAAVHDFIKGNFINCDGKRCDTVDIFYDQGHLDEAKKSVAMMEALIGDTHPCAVHHFYSPEETKAKFFAENSLGSIRYEAGSLSAYKLTIGILKLAIQRGLNLQTNTPVTSIQKEAGPYGNNIWHAKTDRGTITTSTLILATNGYTAGLYPKLDQVIVPFRGVVTAQRPGQKLPYSGNLPMTYSFVYKEGYEYMITRPSITSTSEPSINGTMEEPQSYDIVIGGGLTKTPNRGNSEFYTIDDTKSSIPDSISSYLDACTPDFFGTSWGPHHPQGTRRYLWSGIMGYSADGHPLVGPMPDEEGLWIDASFQGHGMVLCWLCAQAVSEMILGKDGPELDTWFPKSFRVTPERLAKKFDSRVVGRDLSEAESVNGQSEVTV